MEGSKSIVVAEIEAKLPPLSRINRKMSQDQDDSTHCVMGSRSQALEEAELVLSSSEYVKIRQRLEKIVGVDAKLGPFAHRESAVERPSKTRRVEDSQLFGWTKETLTDVDSNEESVLFILAYASMNLWMDEEKVDESEGCVIVTTKRLLFIAKDEESKDLAIDAICVTLHAMASDPELCVYCQLSSNSMRKLSCKSTAADAEDDVRNTVTMLTGEADDPECNQIELFFAPRIQNNHGDEDQNKEIKMKLCDDFFKALGILASLNPSCDNEGNDMFDSDYFESSEDTTGGATDENHFVCRLSNNQYSDSEEFATDEERKAMLDRLDAVLTVPPELECIQEGQFEDADEENDLL